MENIIKCKCGLVKTNENEELFPKYGKLCKVCERKRQKEYYQKNKDKISERKKNHYKKYKIPYSELPREEKDKRNKLCNESKRKRRLKDPNFSLKETISGSIRRGFRENGYEKKSKTYEILGCSFEEFKKHLESKFEDWQNWGNRGLFNGEPNFANPQILILNVF